MLSQISCDVWIYYYLDLSLISSPWCRTNRWWHFQCLHKNPRPVQGLNNLWLKPSGTLRLPHVCTGLVNVLPLKSKNDSAILGQFVWRACKKSHCRVDSIVTINDKCQPRMQGTAGKSTEWSVHQGSVLHVILQSSFAVSPSHCDSLSSVCYLFSVSDTLLALNYKSTCDKCYLLLLSSQFLFPELV